MEKILRVEETIFKTSEEDWSYYEGYQVITDQQQLNSVLSEPLQQCNVVGSAFNWEYFFGGGKIPYQEHYYKCEVNGKRLEKHTFRGGVEYSVGNMDKAKKKYKTEKELLQAICENCGRIVD